MSDKLPAWLSRLLTVPTSSWKIADWRNAALLMGEYWAELPSRWSPDGMGLLGSGSIIGAVERKVISHGKRRGRPPKLSREQAASGLESLESRRKRIAEEKAVPAGRVTYKAAIEEIVSSSPKSSGLRKDKQRALVREMQNHAKALKKRVKSG